MAKLPTISSQTYPILSCLTLLECGSLITLPSFQSQLWNYALTTLKHLPAGQVGNCHSEMTTTQVMSNSSSQSRTKYPGCWPMRGREGWVTPPGFSGSQFCLTTISRKRAVHKEHWHFYRLSSSGRFCIQYSYHPHISHEGEYKPVVTDRTA